MCPAHLKAHIRFNLTRLPACTTVRSAIETFLEARQSSSNPDAMNIGSLDGQSVPNVARLVREAKVTMAKGKAMVANRLNDRYLKGTAITIAHCVPWKRIGHFGAAVSAAPKPLGDGSPMRIAEPRSCKTATGEPHRCMNFRVASVHKALVSASKVCHKVIESSCFPGPGQSGVPSQTHR